LGADGDRDGGERDRGTASGGQSLLAGTSLPNADLDRGTDDDDDDDDDDGAAKNGPGYGGRSAE
jgi:hypothetical protein